MKRIHNRLAILLIFALLLSLAAPVGAAGSRITIRTPEDLVELSRRCSLDSWSRGKTVVLSADLDLSDVEFSSIPTFGGTFDGQGYTISGLTITGSGNVRGLFRYLQSGGVVQNVSLEVTIEPTDLQDSLGGLVGNNRGSVRNCTVTGSIQGETNIGGIIGVNESSGKIINSTFSGSVTGEHYVGGIAGQNLGSILQCVNQGKINTVAVEGEADLEDLDSRPLNSTENLLPARTSAESQVSPPVFCKAVRTQVLLAMSMWDTTSVESPDGSRLPKRLHQPRRHSGPQGCRRDCGTAGA